MWVPRAQVEPAMVTGTRAFAGCCPDSRPSHSGRQGKVKEALPEVESGEVSWKSAGFRGEEPGVSVREHAWVCAGFRDSRHWGPWGWPAAEQKFGHVGKELSLLSQGVAGGKHREQPRRGDGEGAGQRGRRMASSTHTADSTVHRPGPDPGAAPAHGSLSVRIYKRRGTGLDAPVPPTGHWYRHGMAARSYINVSPLVLALEV